MFKCVQFAIFIEENSRYETYAKIYRKFTDVERCSKELYLSILRNTTLALFDCTHFAILAFNECFS